MGDIDSAIAALRALFEDEASGEVRAAGFALLDVAEAAVAVAQGLESELAAKDAELAELRDFRDRYDEDADARLRAALEDAHQALATIASGRAEHNCGELCPVCIARAACERIDVASAPKAAEPACGVPGAHFECGPDPYKVAAPEAVAEEGEQPIPDAPTYCTRPDPMDGKVCNLDLPCPVHDGGSDA